MFEKPEQKIYGAKPFWAWNGKLEKDELLRQVHIMKEMGFGGFFMHSRTGLATEYLGNEWFELINECADEAEKLDMEAWLYDEDRWPSGYAGGEVTKKLENRLKYLRMNLVIPSVFEWSDDIICAFAADVDGINVSNCFEISSHTDISVLETKNIIYFTTEVMQPTDWYNGYTYLDTMSKSAVADFINLTHEKYKKFCGDRLGKTIKGIFTDEPHRGDVMCGFCGNNRDPFFITPYTENLFAEFENAFGYKLQPKLPELFLRVDGAPVSQVKWHYMELLTRLFVNNYAKQYYAWCRENNIISTGHILHEDTLTCQATMMGSVMRYYEYMDFPGVDVLTENNRNYCIVKQLASTAHQTGKKFLLSELDGCTGWQMTFQNYKAIGDWQAIMGITLRCPHLSWYTMQGEAKRDYPASILHQSAWYKAYSVLEEYYARIAEIVANSEQECDTLVISPVESVWAQIYAGWAHQLTAASTEVETLEEKFSGLYNELLSNHIDFDYADEEMLGRLGKTVGKTLFVGKAEYKKVIVHAMTTMRSTTLAKLKEFAQNGGEVIFIDDAPSYVDAAASDEPKSFMQSCTKLKFEDIPSLCVKTKVSSPEIILQTYKDDKNTYYFMLNTNRTEKVCGVTAEFAEKIVPQIWSAIDGKKQSLSESESKLLLDFEAGELKIIVDSGSCLEEVDEIAAYKKLQTVYPDEKPEISTEEPNVLVLDYVSYTINGAEPSPETEVLIADRQIRPKLGLAVRGGGMLQPWVTEKKQLEKKADVTLHYSFNVKDVPSPVCLMLEEAENFDITFNGRPVDKKIKDGIFIDKCFNLIDVTAYITEGLNMVSLSTEYKESTNLEAIYLLGDFCVSMPDKTITAKTDSVDYGSIVNQGFPFYGGKITYNLKFKRRLTGNERAVLVLDGYENTACAKVCQKFIPFPPYECDVTDAIKENGAVNVSLFLTRRNMFGPLHGIEKHPYAIGPEHFYGGDSKEYVLFESGILQKPHIEIRTYGGENN